MENMYILYVLSLRNVICLLKFLFIRNQAGFNSMQLQGKHTFLWFLHLVILEYHVLCVGTVDGRVCE